MLKLVSNWLILLSLSTRFRHADPIVPVQIPSMRTCNWNKPADLSPNERFLAFDVQEPGRHDAIAPNGSFSRSGVPIVFVGSDI